MSRTSTLEFTAEGQYPPLSTSTADQSKATSTPATSGASSFQDLVIEENGRAERETTALRPPDEGFAWVFLAAAFSVETLCWGFAFSVGIFREYWATHMFPGDSAGFILTLASTLQTGVMYMACILAGLGYTRYPEYRQHARWAGLALSVSGILASAFVSKSWHLILTAGLMYPLGGSVYYTYSTNLLFEWFHRRRGLASGIMYSGTGFGGFVFPLVMQTLLQKYSYKAALISLAVGYAVLGSIALCFVQERVPVPKRRWNAPAPRTKIPTSFLRNNAFYCFGLAILLTSLGNFLPPLYTLNLATELGLGVNKGTLLVSMMNVASVIGLLLLGLMSDRWNIRLVVATSCFGAALSCFLLWSFATKLGILMAFAICFGVFGLGFTAIWAKLVTIVARDDPLQPPLIVSIYSFVRGIGNVLSGPISTLLLRHSQMHGKFMYGVDGYGGLLIWTGSVIALGSVAGMVYREK